MQEKKKKKKLKQELSKTIHFGVKPKMANGTFVLKNRKFVEGKKWKKLSKKRKKTLKQELSKTLNFGVKPKMANINFVEKNRKFVGKKKVVSEKKNGPLVTSK